ncbi:MAG: hypothetical protein AAF441_28790, partial [Pseudomonadota bacterium]
MNDHSQLKPVCFMVMPFRKRQVAGPVRGDAPKEIDCDALWDKAFKPAIEKAGYLAIRADFDTGSVIVLDMFQRLAFADLVLADVTLPNGNVYYELGLRHAARETGCIMLAAEWSKQLFDIEQLRAVQYPLADGNVPDEQAAAIYKTVLGQINHRKDNLSPWHELISGVRNDDPSRSAFRESAEKLSAFQADVSTVRKIEDKGRKREKLADLRNTLSDSALNIKEVAIEILYLVRDELGWQETVEFIESLPNSIREIPLIEEQRLL